MGPNLPNPMHAIVNALHPALRAAANVATLGEYQHPGSLRQYGGEFLHSVDPRTSSGATNLALLLSGRGTGASSSQLLGGTHRWHDHSDAAFESAARELMFPKHPTAYFNDTKGFRQASPIGNQQTALQKAYLKQLSGQELGMSEQLIMDSPSLWPAADRMGWTSGRPITDLLYNVFENMPEANHPSPVFHDLSVKMAQSLLGTHPSGEGPLHPPSALSDQHMQAIVDALLRIPYHHN